MVETLASATTTKRLPTVIGDIASHRIGINVIGKKILDETSSLSATINLVLTYAMRV